MGTVVECHHPREDRTAPKAKDGAVISNAELGVWPQDKSARKHLRRVIEEIASVEVNAGNQACDECGQLYIMRSLVPPRKRPPSREGCSERKGEVHESFQRNEGGVWESTGVTKWRGNKSLLTWPPTISMLPPYWAIDEGNPGEPNPEKQTTGTARLRWRDSTDDVSRIKKVREAGYFPEVMTAAPSAESDEENGFSIDRLGFPTKRRPTAYRREMRNELSPDFEVWLESHMNLIGPQADTLERLHEAKLLLDT